MSQKDQKSNEEQIEMSSLSEIISPMFGHDYQNRVVVKNSNQVGNQTQTTSYLDQHIEAEIAAFNHQTALSNYQTPIQHEDDILLKYHKQKIITENQAALPSNYFTFQEKQLKINHELKSEQTVEIVKPENESVNHEG